MKTRNPVKVWNEPLTIPTYKTHPPEKSPLFIEKRAYQGSTGKVYPLPVTEKLSDQKEDVAYNAVFLENDFLKVIILPELGGRIQRALDKTNNYDFVYYNHVIKPALVGLTGPWISGGIEFNWPQHHRPSTYSPVDYHFTQNADGSCSVYLSETDKMYGTKGMAILTLYPDKSYIEIKGQLYNRTDTPQTFLWWANPAVPVNKHTYSVFPPDVTAVMDHGKRAVSTFPIATGEYYKYDYSAGIDISRYENIKVPTSYMAAHSDYDFIGNYDEALDAGLLHVADHHVSPGKKQWTWGNSDFGQAWDRNLTETDGPYIELMTGVFTDNQPDFTWLKPYEEKTFTQYFMPYKGVGRVKNATKNAMLNLEIENGKAYFKLYSSGCYEQASISISYKKTPIFNAAIDLSPESFYQTAFDTELSSPAGCTVTVHSQSGELLVDYQAVEQKLEPTPEPAAPLLPPHQLKSTEELYLGALHLEQYRHATYEPADYYLEGLRRDESDIRLNNGYGMLQYKRGNFAEAIDLFKRAIEKQTWKNPNPYHGECYFNLGLALEAAGKSNQAFDAFYKSTWSHETSSAGFYWLANLSCRNNKYQEALSFIEQSLIRNWHNMKTRTLKAALLRISEMPSEDFLNECAAIDPLYMGILYEQALFHNNLDEWLGNTDYDVNNYLELALDYMKCGMHSDALNVLSSCRRESPLLHYYAGYTYALGGNAAKAWECYRQAEASAPDYCFPNKTEEINILNHAIHSLELAPFASYYLGNLLYDKKQYETAILLWEKSIAENPEYAMAYRNLAIAYYNKREDRNKAMQYMEKAYQIEPDNSRFLMELDQLSAKNQVSMAMRLSLLEQHSDLAASRDALYLEYLTLLNNTGQYRTALDGILAYQFHPWEGGEGKVSAQYRFALTELGRKEMEHGNYEKAIELFHETLTYPHSLGEGKLPNTQDNIAHYYIGMSYQALGNRKKAAEYFQAASVGLAEPSSVLYYNDQPSDTIFYQGLAYEALGNAGLARKSYYQLLAFGQKHLFDQVDYDYFAVSLPEIEVFPTNIQERNDIYCRYLMGLGYLGLQEYDKARDEFHKALHKQPDHQGVLRHLQILEQKEH